ncbi:MAG: hypothetical protein KA761_11825, partial [Gemmatimonadaceae bacterium]|nr:hypothetical protein [Gemmatimonadaceae bacterium]
MDRMGLGGDPLATVGVTRAATGAADPAFDAEMAARARAEADAMPVDVIAGAPSPVPPPVGPAIDAVAGSATGASAFAGLPVTPPAVGPVNAAADAEMMRAALAGGGGPMIASPEEMRASRTAADLTTTLETPEAAFLRALGGGEATATAPVSLPGTVDSGAALADVLANPPARRRFVGGRPSGRTAGPAAEPTDPLLDALIARPMDAANPYDNRAETGLERDLRLNADAETLAVRRAENSAIAAANVRDVYEGEARARSELETERRNATRAGMDSYRRAVDRAASLNIDPDGFYHSRGTGGTIAASIAIGLGGLGAAINGGPNVALDMINAEIERDLMAQQQRIDSAWQRADAEGTLYDMTRAEFGDREAALNAARSIALENAAAQAEEQAGMLGTAEARLQGEALAAELRDAAVSSRAEAERAEIEWQLRMMNLEG